MNDVNRSKCFVAKQEMKKKKLKRYTFVIKVQFYYGNWVIIHKLQNKTFGSNNRLQYMIYLFIINNPLQIRFR